MPLARLLAWGVGECPPRLMVAVLDAMDDAEINRLKSLLGREIVKREGNRLVSRGAIETVDIGEVLD